MSKSEWLAIRETMDGRFRSSQLADEFIEHASRTRLIIDLGCGTGTNYRYLTRNDGSDTPWLGVDSDGDVLKIAARELAGTPVRFELADLASDLSLISTSEDVSIAASAFLDLASEEWIGRFANVAAGKPLLISMTASGPPSWDPVDNMDEAIEACLQNHRKADHGFGPSAGFSAARLLADELNARNCSVSLEASDWLVDHQDREVIATLIDGVRRRVFLDLPHDQVEQWAATRRQQNQAGVLKLTLPHLDLLSLPPRT
ncbi:MAG: class I SAM-dependent methyltransferase [Rubripirellula sp.]